MDVVVLGSGSPIPDPQRAGPATLVRAGGTDVLIDCGRGVLLRAAAIGASAAGLAAVLLTHLHSDHWTDLGDIVTTRWITTFTSTPLPVFGPGRTSEVVDGVLASLAPDVDFRLEHHDDLEVGPEVDVTELRGDDEFMIADVRVRVAPTEHRPAAPSVAYRLEHGGQAVVLAGDTLPCAALDELAAGADALVHTVIREDLIRAIPLARLQDVCDYHSTVEQAAQTAARAGVGRLVLTHCVPPVAPTTVEEWRSLATEHFDGMVDVADDLTTISLT